MSKRRKKTREAWKAHQRTGRHPSVHICGFRPPPRSVLPNLLLAVFMAPLLAIGGSLLYGALESIPPAGPTRFLDFLLFVPGIGFVGLWCYVLWKWWVWIPGITITQFELLGRALRFHTASLGHVEISLDDVCRCYTQPSEVGASGWWMQTRTHGWVFLQRDRAKADELAVHLLNLPVPKPAR